MNKKQHLYGNSPKALFDLFFTFFRISFFTIGGGVAMIPMVRDAAVDKKKWLTEEEMIDCIAVAQSLPGAVIINTATYIGKRRAGFVGALLCTFGTVLPSVIVMSVLVSLVSVIGDNSYLSGFFKGALSAAAAMIAVAAYRMGKPVLKRAGDWVLALLAFVALIVFRIGILYIIPVSIAVGFGLYFLRKYRAKRKAAGSGYAPEED
jgi:chromate transporter